MHLLISTWVFLFGLAIGSFLNVVITRLHEGEDIVKKRSHCPKCRKILSWYELVPVFSFIAQRGKCRGCGKSISLQYPAVELATGLLFLGIFNFQFSIFSEFSIFNFQILELLYLWIITAGLLVIFVYDLKHYIIPDKVLLPLVLVVLGFRIWNLFVSWDLGFGISEGLGAALIAGLGASLFFFSLYFFSKGKALGFGDVKLAFFMGLLLGWPNIFVGLFMGFLLGAIIGVGLIIAGKKKMKSKVPFGPFLIAGTFIALFWGNQIINWYWGLFL